MISEAAYYHALERGLKDGDPVGDWLAAEREIDAKFDIAPHDAKLAQLYKQLAEANDKLHEIAAKVKSEAREEWNEEMARLQKLRDAFSAKLDEIRSQTGETKDEAKQKADELWNDLATRLKRMGGPS